MAMLVIFHAWHSSVERYVPNRACTSRFLHRVHWHTAVYGYDSDACRVVTRLLERHNPDLLKKYESALLNSYIEVLADAISLHAV